MESSSLKALRSDLKHCARKERAALNLRFFKTGPGEYGEGDQFIGATMPELRQIARDFRDLDLEDLKTLLYSPIHEERMVALIILTLQMPKIPNERMVALKDFYLQHRARVNNWDLVDVSAHKILGPYCEHYGSDILYNLADQDHLWSQRIAIVTNWYLIKKGQLHDIYALSEILLSHPHDLMHKAIGWMLREAGKKDQKRLKQWIEKHYSQMPRTCLRYAIEKFPEVERKEILKGIFN